MWKSLSLTQKVYQGDKIRLHHATREGNNPAYLFQVVKTDEHYFEVLPIIQESDSRQDQFSKKIFRYFDIGYYIQIEVWDEKNTYFENNV